MSGVLDRMVARTRGTLPSVEPLAKPRFQAVAAEMPQEILIEKQQGMRQDRPQQSKFQEQGVMAQVRRQQALIPKFNEEVEKQSRFIAVKSAEAKRSSATADSIARPDAEKREPSPTTALNIPTPRLASEDRAPLPEAHDSVHRNSDEETKKRLSLAARPKVQSEELFPVASKPQISIEKDASAGIVEEPQTMPEIRISIGAIELQVTPREEGPRPASFRPRVSLDNFLGRSRG